MIDYVIRKKTSDLNVNIEDFFYDTFYVPDGLTSLPREILNLPFYQKYFSNLGDEKGDFCYVAYDTTRDAVIGVVWTRLISDDMKIDNNTPFLFISVFDEYRGKGIGTSLLLQILSELKCAGYERVVLSVHRDNRAVALYKKFGFSAYDNDSDCYLMVRKL